MMLMVENHLFFHLGSFCSNSVFGFIIGFVCVCVSQSVSVFAIYSEHVCHSRLAVAMVKLGSFLFSLLSLSPPRSLGFLHSVN